MRKTKSFQEYLGGNAYPGRGVFIGMTPDTKKAVLAYFIMGRSENSRNRVFAEKGDTLTIFPFDASKLTDPSLIIYDPVRALQGEIIVSNGDQTATIYEYREAGKSFEEALRSRCFEPDAPNYTPRISGLIRFGEQGFSYKMSILKCDDGAGESCLRAFYEFTPQAGTGHLLTTYRADGTPLPSFEGEPAALQTQNDIDGFFENVWNALNEENRISLYLRYIDLQTGKTKSRLRNKNGG